MRRAEILAADATAVLLLGATVVWLAGHDGGYLIHGQPALLWVAAFALLAVPVAAAEAARLGAMARWALALWGLGALLAFAFAWERSGFVATALAYSVAPIAGLCTARLQRRAWGPYVLVGLLLVAFTAYTWRSGLQWWGHLLGGQTPSWRPLSWHNQSSALMAAFALLAAGFALNGRPRWALAGGAVAAMAGAGVFLSQSRGGALAAVLGLTALVALSLRGRSWGPVVARLAGVAAVAALLVVAMTATIPTGEGPARGPDAGAAQNAWARMHHAAAAVSMAAERPLVGQGLGSYRALSRGHTSPRANLTRSAHNEFVEALAHGGIALGIPLLLGGAAAASLARRRWRAFLGLNTLDRSLVAGGAGAAVALAAHAAIDFDWHYLILPALLMIAVALVGAPAPEAPRPWRALAAGPLALLLLVGTAGLVVERRPEPAPWSWQGAQTRASMDRALVWNPAVSDLRTRSALLEFEAGATSPDALLATLDDRSSFAARNATARALIDQGYHREARALLRPLVDAYPQYVAWQPQRSAAGSWSLLVRLDAAEHGCATARRTATEAERSPVLDDDGRQLVAAVLREACPATR